MGSKRLKMDIQTASNGECPVCFQIPRGKIFNICVNGHYLCEACSTKVTTCPECRSPGTKVRNLLAERLLDAIKFPCSWSGCDETMNRGELTDHEDQCAKNSDTVQFCSMFPNGKKCHYKFTSKWLSEFFNCNDFIRHVDTCVGYRYYEIFMQHGIKRHTYVRLRDISNKSIPTTPVDLYCKPDFHRVHLPNDDKVELFFLIPLLKVDKLGNKFVFFAYIQLTPEMIPMQVKFTINANPNSRMDSQWGPNSLASQSWTQQRIGFKEFVEMVKTFKRRPEAGIQLPFTLLLSFLSEYYLDEDEDLSVNFSVEQTS